MTDGRPMWPTMVVSCCMIASAPQEDPMFVLTLMLVIFVSAARQDYALTRNPFLSLRSGRN